MSFKDLKDCLACGYSKLEKYLDLGSQPLANTYTKEPTILPTYDLGVNFCSNCSHSQLTIAVDPKLMFSDYKYVSGTTQTLRNYFKSFAEDFYPKRLSDTPIKPYGNVLEIGSNEGLLLKEFKDRGFKVMGVDPAENLRVLSEDKDVPTLVDFWNSNTAYKLVDKYKLIIGMNVFAHNLDPADFLKGCARVLESGGSVVIEFPLGSQTIINNQFQQIYHEHISYFNVRSMAALVERCGFYIDAIKETPVHGGSMRFTLKRGLDSHCYDALSAIRNEAKFGLDNIQTYKTFAGNSLKIIENLAEMLTKLKQENPERSIISYAASAKSSVLFNSPNFKNAINTINWVVDDNELKQGMYCPGSRLEIKSVESLRGLKNPIIICNAFNFMDEIKTRISKIVDEYTLISVMPKVQKFEMKKVF